MFRGNKDAETQDQWQTVSEDEQWWTYLPEPVPEI